LSLLFIDSFHRELADQEQWIRALALRVLSSIRIPDNCKFKSWAFKNVPTINPHTSVRKCAANAFSKLAPRCDAAEEEMLLDMNQALLDSDSCTCTMVLSSALIAVTELCPTDFHLKRGGLQ
jgi:AP-3 complex subunit beta